MKVPVTYNVIRDCYLKDMGYKFVAQRFGLEEKIVEQIYAELDKIHRSPKNLAV